MPHQPLGRARRPGRRVGLALAPVPGGEHGARRRRRTPARSSSGPVSRNTNTSASAPASVTGHGESDGMSSTSSSSPSDHRGRRRLVASGEHELAARDAALVRLAVALVPHRVRARDRRDDREVVRRRRATSSAHSSVAPSNGSRPAGAPAEAGCTARFTTTSSSPAGEQVGAERLEQVRARSSPAPAGYVYWRRGIPSSPSDVHREERHAPCPANASQNDSLPDALVVHPAVTFGNQ